MDPVALLEAAKKDGVIVKAIDGELEIEAKADQRHWLNKLRPHKAELIESLNGSHVEPPPEETKPLPLPFLPFPIHALPSVLRGFVSVNAKAIGCDISFIILPLLSALGAAIGTTRRIQLKPGWCEPPNLWTVIIGYSGELKSPAFRCVMKLIHYLQKIAFERYAEEHEQWKVNFVNWERDFAKWKKGNSNDDPPERPEEPQAVRRIVSDTTVEALAPLLQANDRGLLLSRDELAGFFGSFDRYAGGKGSDSSHWLSMHNVESIIVDRKSGEPKYLSKNYSVFFGCGRIV